MEQAGHEFGVMPEGFAFPDGGTFAVQCRPRLVVSRTANVKSDDGKRAERSALCTRAGARTVEWTALKPDMPVTYTYTKDGDRMVVTKVTLAKPLSYYEKKETETTTTTTKP